MAPHSSTVARKIPWMEEPGGLPSLGSHRVGHNYSDLAAAAAASRLKVGSLRFGAGLIEDSAFVSLFFCVLSLLILSLQV